ncbi:hypothetical protein GCM10010313_56140 [Streptomyces violarus]|uniref:Uncharacterized protein n=1 Tax=Streptomyces violarus TaxID=67380 RepID=A0A7W5F1R2_9ACTN|nr:MULTISPECIES: hypothetical protein [Streptomyces]MBB3076759.1 hypothetical protein [Streptomyces violarus]WRU01573.1 hypothetical protein VJ737_29575 [Streptomyces sp. CGMCC 4.1772]GHD21951.1 hypothetical protein GCM10010313_56140 [Streptomyces violarus]
MAGPRVAVVAPLTGPRTDWGAALLGHLERVRAARPDAAEWHVYDEAPEVARTVAAAGYAAVVGHADAEGARRALPVYQAAGLTCLLPFVRAGAPALSWAPDGDALARRIVEGALALGVDALAVAQDEEPGWAALGLAVGEEAGRAGLAPGPGGALAVLAPQDRFARFAQGAGPVLTPTDCGLVSFAQLRHAASDREVWAVHPQMCAARRVRAAVTALAQALSEAPALRGTALMDAVRARSGTLLTAEGAPLGDGWLISRLPWACAAGTPL